MVISGGDNESGTRNSLQACRDLAARLSAMFVGAARNRHRDELLTIVQQGIEYAFEDAPKQLSFLECCVIYFVSKLPVSDVLETIKGVQKKTKNVNTDEDPSGWRPYHSFFETLQEKYNTSEGIPEEEEGTSMRRRGRPRKPQSVEGRRLFYRQEEEDDSISMSDQEDGQDNEEDDVPLINTIRSSPKRRSLIASRDESRAQSKTTGVPPRALDASAASRS